MERVKILLQTGKGAVASKPYYPGDKVRRGTTTMTVPNSTDYQAKSLLLHCFQVVKRVLAEQGALAFWRGNGAQVCRVFPVTAIKFACYDQVPLVP